MVVKNNCKHLLRDVLNETLLIELCDKVDNETLEFVAAQQALNIDSCSLFILEPTENGERIMRSDHPGMEDDI